MGRDSRHLMRRMDWEQPMFVTVVAILCHLNSTVCVEEIVTSSSLDSNATFQSCLMGGQAGLAKWKSEHPIYRSEEWHVQRYKCVPGDYNLHARI
jgi:hypothetical protein